MAAHGHMKPEVLNIIESTMCICLSGWNFKDSKDFKSHLLFETFRKAAKSNHDTTNQKRQLCVVIQLSKAPIFNRSGFCSFENNHFSELLRFCFSAALMRLRKGLGRPPQWSLGHHFRGELLFFFLFLFQPQTLYVQVKPHSSQLQMCSVGWFHSIQVGGPPPS